MIVLALFLFFLLINIFIFSVVVSFRPDSSEPFALVESVTEIIIDFPTSVVLGTIDLVDDVNVESFEVSFINSDGNQSPFLVRFCYYLFICFIFILTGYQSIVVKRYYLMYCKNANVKITV